ncbi:MAG TPA: translation elongation factor Ts [Chitinophagales bacterium]|nr:translation elongation factor Ts [Chitinophagales bacterium]
MSATITAQAVNELRLKTGAGLMDCKKALAESNGDMQAAIDYLRKKGAKVSELRAGKAANEGVAIAKTSPDGRTGVAINLSSETDFVAKNDEFVSFAQQVVDLALREQPDSLDELLNLSINGNSVKDRLNDLVGKINENIKLSKYEKLSGEAVVAYNHSNKVAVLVQLNKPLSPTVESIGKDIAMQVAAMNPAAIDPASVDQATLNRELEIGREQARAEGKPENMLDKIAQGKLQKFFKESTLLNQQFVKDHNKTVEQALREADKELKVVAFKRVTLGS